MVKFLVVAWAGRTIERLAYRARNTNLSGASHESVTHDHNSCRNAERQCDLNHTSIPVSRTAPRLLNMFGPNADSHHTTHHMGNPGYPHSCFQLLGRSHWTGVAEQLSKHFVRIRLRRLSHSRRKLATSLYKLK